MNSPRTRPVTLAHADPALNADGVPFSSVFGDVYHSADGAAEQARHVFLRGNGLPERWRGRRQFTIVETGFGLGLNFLEAWRAFEEDARAPQALHFVSVESHPLSREALARLQARWPQHAARSRELLAAWPLPLAGFHRLHFGHGRITLTLLLGDAGELLPQLQAHADAFFLDGFAPAKNPQLWSRDIFTELARIAAPGATLATWTVAAAVRDGLAAAGFAIEKRAGFGSKRDMLAGRRDGDEAAGVPALRERRAIVIGAGLAGCMVAERLAARGWEVEVLERYATAAQEASGNPLGLASPLLNLADEANARLSRAAFLYALRYYAALAVPPVPPRPGVLRIARDERDAARFAQLLERLVYPPQFAAYADIGEGTRLAGRAVSRAGLWFPTGMALSPAAACAAALTRWPQRVRQRHSVHADRVEPVAHGWQVLDAQGARIAEAPVVVLAGGALLHAFEQAVLLPLERIRGQVTLLPPDTARRLDVAVSGDRHAVQLPDGRCMIGASFQPGDDDDAVRAADHAENIAAVDAMLPGFCAGIAPDAATLSGRTGFRAVTPDRLPLFGPLSRRRGAAGGVADRAGMPPGLMVAGGLGARGIVWAPLGAELIAAQLDEEPWPLSRELALSVDPERFKKRNS